MKLNPPDKVSNGRPPVFEFAEFSLDAKDKVLYKRVEIDTACAEGLRNT